MHIQTTHELDLNRAQKSGMAIFTTFECNFYTNNVTAWIQYPWFSANF